MSWGEGSKELGRVGAWRGEAVEYDGVIRRGGAKLAEDADKTFKVDIAVLVAVVVGARSMTAGTYTSVPGAGPRAHHGRGGGGQTGTRRRKGARGCRHAGRGSMRGMGLRAVLLRRQKKGGGGIYGGDGADLDELAAAVRDDARELGVDVGGADVVLREPWLELGPLPL